MTLRPERRVHRRADAEKSAAVTIAAAVNLDAVAARRAVLAVLLRGVARGANRPLTSRELIRALQGDQKRFGSYLLEDIRVMAVRRAGRRLNSRGVIRATHSA